MGFPIVHTHYSDVIMSVMASQISSLTIVYSSVIQVQIKEYIKAPRHCLLFGEFTVDRGHKGPVTRKMFPFDDVIIDRASYGVSF